MPMTWPDMFASGPPELPGLIAASVWTASITVSWPPLPPPARTGRCSELTMPEVTVPASSNGEPMATTDWPTRRSSEPDLHRGQPVDAVDLDDRDVGRRVAADDLRRRLLAVLEHGLDLAAVRGDRDH